MMSAARPLTTLGELSVFSPIKRVRERKGGELHVEYKDKDQIPDRFNSLRKKLGLRETSLLQESFPGQGQHISGPSWSRYIPGSELDKSVLKTILTGIKQKKTDDDIIADLNKIKEFPEFIKAEKERDFSRPISP